MTVELNEIIRLIEDKEFEEVQSLLGKSKELSFFRTNISLDTMKALCGLLKINKTITTLDLYYSELNDLCFKEINEVIKSNTSITKVNISYNKGVEVKTFQEAICAIQQNKSIREVDISHNNFDPDIIYKIVELIRIPSSLVSINLNNSEAFNKDDMDRIISAYKTNGTLLKITLPETQEGIKVIEKLNENFIFNANEFVSCFEEFMQCRENKESHEIILRQKLGDNNHRVYGFKGLVHAFQKRGEVILSQVNNNELKCDKHIEEFKKIVADNFFKLSGVCSAEPWGENCYLPSEITAKIFYGLPLIEYECTTLGAD